MQIVRKSIKSARSTKSPLPWFDIAVSNDAINVGLGNHKGKALPSKATGRVNRGQFRAAMARMVPPETLVVAAVTLDGTLVVLKWEGATPEILELDPQYTHAGILAIMATPAWTPAWTPPEEEPDP